jgi:hypothetical protein
MSRTVSPLPVRRATSSHSARTAFVIEVSGRNPFWTQHGLCMVERSGYYVVGDIVQAHLLTDFRLRTDARCVPLFGFRPLARVLSTAVSCRLACVCAARRTADHRESVPSSWLRKPLWTVLFRIHRIHR